MYITCKDYERNTRIHFEILQNLHGIREPDFRVSILGTLTL